MLRPLTGNVPWPLVIAIAQTKCLLGREEDYVAGQKPYDGGETFETSGCTSRPRFEKYNEMRKENKKFQVSAASYGWLLASVKMSWYIKYCGWKKLTAPVLLFQAERDDFVSVNALTAAPRRKPLPPEMPPSKANLRFFPAGPPGSLAKPYTAAAVPAAYQAEKRDRKPLPPQDRLRQQPKPRQCRSRPEGEKPFTRTLLKRQINPV